MKLIETFWMYFKEKIVRYNTFIQTMRLLDR